MFKSLQKILLNTVFITLASLWSLSAVGASAIPLTRWLTQSDTQQSIPRVVTHTSITASTQHTCAITATARVMCWGRNNYGQLGDGSTSTRLYPVAVQSLATGVTAVATGEYHSCAVTATGTVKCWGNNENGQLGNGTTTSSTTPVDVSDLSGVVALTIGTDHACAVTSAGAVKCWGSNDSGKLGNGDKGDTYLTPIDVVGLSSGVQRVTAGMSHTCALMNNKSVKCWGANYDGQLGDGTTTSRLVPTDVPVLGTTVVSLSTRHLHTCAVTTVGAVKCWGNNALGQLGDNTTNQRNVPTSVSNLTSGVSSIHVGHEHSCAVTSSGGVKCWGNNLQGQLGNGTVLNQPTPVNVSALGSGITTLALGNMHTCAMTASATVTCWGNNSYGQQGNGTTTNSNIPAESVNFSPPATPTPTATPGIIDPFTPIALGREHTCVLTMTGGVKCWGSNLYGQLGNGTTSDSNVPIDVPGLTSGVAAISLGDYHTCALLTNGGLTCWGRNQVGQLGDGSDVDRHTPTHVSGLSAGVAVVDAQETRTCVVTTAGTVKCWGLYIGINPSDVCGIEETQCFKTPTDESHIGSTVIDIAVGNGHTCVLTTSHAVKCWGMNAMGQLGNGTRLNSYNSAVTSTGLSSGVVAIAAGSAVSCALLANGGMKCWGDNYYGQLGDGTRLHSVDIPSTVLTLTSGVSAIAVGEQNTCAVLQNGGVKCWGVNDHTEITLAGSPGTTPVDITTLTSGVAMVEIGTYHACALTTTGTVKCWGANDVGQLGDGTTTHRLTPVAVVAIGTPPTATHTPTANSTATITRTATSTHTATRTHTVTFTSSLTRTATNTRTNTPTRTATRTATNTRTRTATFTSSLTRTATNTRTNTPTRTATRTATNTRTRTATLTSSLTRTATNTRTNTPTRTATRTHTGTRTHTATKTSVVTVTPP
jgi:alpha-tubulin suppressor-like RCC1 family protein